MECRRGPGRSRTAVASMGQGRLSFAALRAPESARSAWLRGTPGPRVRALVLAVGLGLTSLVRTQAPAAPPSAAVEVVEDVQYAERAPDPRRNRLDLYLPRQRAAAAPAPLALFVHGGSWTTGDKAHGAALGRMLAGQGIACATANMQLHPFAAPTEMVDDVAAALAWLHRHARAHGCAPDQLFLIGHSAGAHLASWAALDAERLRRFGVPPEAVRGVVGCSGVYDVRPRHPLLDAVFGRVPARRADASPLQYASAQAPPFLLLWGERDLPGLAASARMLARRLAEHGVAARGVELPGRDHVDYVLQFGRAVDRVGPTLVGFVRECLVGCGPAPAPVRRGAVVEVEDPDGPAVPGVRLWRPDRGPASPWVVFVTCGAAEQAAAEALAWQLVERGAAAATVALGEPQAVQPATALPQLAATVARMAAVGREWLPAQPPFVGGFAAGGYLAGVVGCGPGAGPMAVRGRLLLGVPTTAASLRTILPQLAPAASLPTAGGSPLLLVVADGDPAPVVADARATVPQLWHADPKHLAVHLPGPALASRRDYGTHADPVLPCVLAFLGL